MLLRLGVVHILTFILVSDLWPVSFADVFSAMFKMEHLLETRQRVINDLDVYIHKEEDRLRDLKMYSKIYKAEQERAMKDMNNYTGNPINAFILIKRLTSDLDDIEERINKTTEFVSVRNVTTDDKNATILYPTSVDLEGAALALKRLQKTYKLKVEDLANGVLNGVVYSNKHNIATGLPMTASDCYKIGVIMFRKKDNLNALAWQMEALRKFKLEDSIPHSFTETDIMEYIGIVYYRLSDIETASDWTMKVLEIDPDNDRANANLAAFERIILQDADELEIVTEINVVDSKNGTEYKNQTKEDAETKDNAGAKAELFLETDNKKEADLDNKTNNKSQTTVEDQTNNKNEGDEKDEAATMVVKDFKNDKSAFKILGANTKNGTGETDTTKETDAKTESDTKTDTDSKTDIDKEDITETHTHAQNSTNNKNGTKSKYLNELVSSRKDMIMYEALCRGEYDIAPEISSRLTCYYKNDKPFLKLAPIKAEQRYIDPDVFIFHDVISDEEIAYVKEIAKPNFKRAVVGDDNATRVSQIRVSQTSWLGDDEDDRKVISRLTQRVGDFTGLDMKYAEHLQISNYGVGGQYEPHFDYFGKLYPKLEPFFDRIATAMFYMSDVTQGGATVFPKLGLSVFPMKGAAVFWNNLLPSGEGNMNTKHAACPVLEGSKWVSNKWISPAGQEFIKPCNLEYQREEVIVQRPPPVRRPEALVEINSW